MAASIASAAAICPRATPLASRASGSVARRAVPARRASVVVPRAASTDGAAYEEVFDGITGQMVKTLTQSVETASAGGLEWSYRRGAPDPDSDATIKPNKVLMVHGAGLNAHTYREVMKEMQESGYECIAPDMPGHGRTSKPAPGGAFKYDAAAYSNALEQFMGAVGIADIANPVDLVVSGYITSQAALLLAASKPALFRRVVILNTPLANGHKLPDSLAVYTRPFGMGKGAAADVYKLAYFGNEFALTAEVMEGYEAPYGAAAGGDAEAARAALEATVMANDLKGLMEMVQKAFQDGGGPKVRLVWGMTDKFLDEAPMFKWAEICRSAFDCMRKVGHMPQEDYPSEAALNIKKFFESEGKLSALKSVRLNRITKDD